MTVALTLCKPENRGVRLPEILRDQPQDGPCSTPPRPNLERLLESIGSPTDEDDCWPWMGTITGNGYGCFSVRLGRKRRRTLAAHRLVYEVLVGPIPDGLEIDHLCRNRRCVNPAHLEPVTASENQIRAKRKSRCKHGHLMTDENVIWLPQRGDHLYRGCRTCRRKHVRESRARQRRATK